MRQLSDLHTRTVPRRGTWDPASRHGSAHCSRPARLASVIVSDEVSNLLSHGKPVAVTEFGCCPYAGAAARGGTGWAIVDHAAGPPRLDGDYTRDEGEQVRYFEEVTQVFREEGVDLAFWYTFAGYYAPRNAGDPRLDLDLASYGVVSMLPAGPAPATRASADQAPRLRHPGQGQRVAGRRIRQGRDARRRR